MRRDVFGAIADATRRTIFVLLASQAMTTKALAERLGMSRQAVSKHLKMLSECELLKTKAAGREIHDSLHAGKMHEIDRWMDQFRKLWSERFDNLDQLLSPLK